MLSAVRFPSTPSPTEIPGEVLRKSHRRVKTGLFLVLITVAVVTAVFLPTILGGWAPVLHYTCVDGKLVVGDLFVWLPAILINSPYGGRGLGVATLPNGTQWGPFNLYSVGAANGSANWGGFGAYVNITQLVNQTVWGPGPNVRCGEGYTVSARYEGGIYLGGGLLPNGSQSDLQEPTLLGFTPHPLGQANVSVDNAFHSANAPDVSTCSGSSLAPPAVHSAGFVIRVPVTPNQVGPLAEYSLPFVGLFHYWFPANFGTWQVDNLSAPGGPGGGWAFNYLGPCV